jgi:septal ring factor EnvC (AmiA/AmiB activator)
LAVRPGLAELMRERLPENQGGMRRHRLLAAASMAALFVCLLLLAGDPAGALTPQQRYDRAQDQLADIAGSVDELRSQVAADNRRVDELLGELAGLRSTADSLTAKLEQRQAELDRMEAELEAERENLREVRRRMERALDVLRRQLVSLYMAGTPDVSEMVLGSSDFSEIVSNTEYAESIQERDEAVIRRVRALREQIRRSVERMEVQEERLQKARDRIAVEQQAAVTARDRVEAQRAEFLATRDMREQRIAALQDRAGTIEGNLPDLSLDPASSSAPAAPAPVSGQSAVLGADGLAAAPAGAPQAVKDAIAAANAIVGMPYLWGGGHGSFESSGYDCSGAVSYALNGAGLLSSPLDSTGLTTWGEPGEGNWITVYGNSGHVYAVIAGLRWDTSDTGGTGPKWHSDLRDNVGFIARHPSGL